MSRLLTGTVGWVFPPAGTELAVVQSFSGDLPFTGRCGNCPKKLHFWTVLLQAAEQTWRGMLLSVCDSCVLTVICWISLSRSHDPTRQRGSRFRRWTQLQAIRAVCSDELLSLFLFYWESMQSHLALHLSFFCSLFVKSWSQNRSPIIFGSWHDMTVRLASEEPKRCYRWEAKGLRL